jgi:hypothetical protein
MTGRHLAIAAVAGLVAFAAAFGIAKAGSGSDGGAEAQTSGTPAKKVTLRSVDLTAAEVRAVGTSGQVARFKPPKPKKTKQEPSSSGGGTATVTATPGASVTATATAVVTATVPPVVTTVPPPPDEEEETGGGVVGGSG